MSESIESSEPEPKFAAGDQVFGPRRDRLMVVTRVEWTSDRYFCGLSDIVPGVPTYGWWMEGELQLHYRPAVEPGPRDAEIEQLRAEVERMKVRLEIQRETSLQNTIEYRAGTERRRKQIAALVTAIAAQRKSHHERTGRLVIERDNARRGCQKLRIERDETRQANAALVADRDSALEEAAASFVSHSLACHNRQQNQPIAATATTK